MNLREVYAQGAECLRAEGIDTPYLDSRILLSRALNIGFEEVITQPYKEVSEEGLGKFESLLERRKRREPVARILGSCGFWTLELLLWSEVFEPRADSETLVATALKWTKSDVPLRVLDLGTGSGGLLLAVLSERPRAIGIGVDIVPEAVRLGSINAQRHALLERTDFVLSNWGQSLRMGNFDLILCNPPYIRESDVEGLEPEVSRYDPLLSLLGGCDGLSCYRVLGPQIARLLSEGGIGVIEFGLGMSTDVITLFIKEGLGVLETVCDLGGRERCVVVGRDSFLLRDDKLRDDKKKNLCTRNGMDGTMTWG